MKLVTQIKILNRLHLFNHLRAHLYKKKNSTPRVLNFYTSLIRKGDLCFDIGANIGEMTDILLRVGAKVVLVEPQEQCLHFLQRKFKNSDQATFVHKALDEKEGERDIFLCENNALASMSEDWILTTQKSGRFTDYHWNENVTVETTTLDNLISQYGQPVFCKIDVEGFELNVLKGLTQPIPYISLEITPESLPLIHNCMKHLTAIGEVKFKHCPYGRYSFSSDEWFGLQQIMNHFKGMPEDQITGDLFAHFVSKDNKTTP